MENNMSKKKDEDGFDWSFSNKSVEDRLNAGREQMKGTADSTPKKKKEGQPSGYLDTQLFPNKKKPYHE